VRLAPFRWPVRRGGHPGGYAAGCVTALVAVAMIALIAGCEDTAPPRVFVPGPNSFYALHQYPADKPLPPEIGPEIPSPPFSDPPIVTQQLPEETEFIQQYLRVGQPRIVVFVNRDLYGQEILAPGQTIYPGTYITREQLNQLQAAQLDYTTIEIMLADWLAADGKVHIVSPSAVHGLLSATQVQYLQSGQSTVLAPIGQTLSADVLVQVQVHPIEQTSLGLKLRLIVEAVNTRDGASIGRFSLDLDPPLDKPHINDYTRFIARKLMDEMTMTWQNYQPSPGQPAIVPMTPLTPSTPTTNPSGAFVQPAAPPTTRPAPADNNFFGTP
jgi:hypothetical protein